MNFAETKHLERLMTAETLIQSLKMGQMELLKKITALEACKDKPSKSSCAEKESKKCPKHDKLKLVNDLIYYCASLNIKFQRDKLSIERGGCEYYDTDDIEYETHMIQEISKALYGED